MYKNNSKLLVKSYVIFCKIYQSITTIYEKIFLKIKSPKKQFRNKANFKLEISNEINQEKMGHIKLVKINDFLSVRLLNDKEINNLIENIFSKTFREKITAITGFNFSIDFLIFYQRQYIPTSKRGVSVLKQPYSYRWHFDKPNSSNMLKIFIPIDIDKDSGPLEIINKTDSKKIKKFKEINKSQKRIYCEGKGNLAYGFYPTLCCHRDGIPNENISANQIMFQLNPNKNWVINSRIFRTNSLLKNKIGIWTTEPKFPHFSYFLNKRIKLD